MAHKDLVAEPLRCNCHAALTGTTKVIAETWRTVDSLFVDRTFNGIDWFAARK